MDHGSLPPLAMCSVCLFADSQGTRLAASLSLSSSLPWNPLHRQLCFGSRGHCPLLNFFACSSPPYCSSKSCNYALGKWCCLSASSWEFDLSWLPALTCLGRARKGNGWELPSNHELVLPPFLFSPYPLPSPTLTKGRIVLHHLERVALKVWFVFFFSFFPFKRNTLWVSPVSIPLQQSRAVITKGRACVCACLQRVFVCSHVVVCGRVVSSGMHLWPGPTLPNIHAYLFDVPAGFTVAWSFTF